MSIELTRTQAKVVTGRSDGLRLITYQSFWSPSGVLFNQGLCAISVNFVSLLANSKFNLFPQVGMPNSSLGQQC